MSNQPVTLPRGANLLGNPPLIVFCLLLIDSFHFVFARMLLPFLPPVTSAFYVLAVATLQLMIFAGLQGQFSLEPFRRNAWFFLAIGFLIAASTAINYSAVIYIDPGTASMLGKSSILFGLGFGLFWLKDRLTRLQLIGVAVAIVGVVIVTFQKGDYLRLGSFMVLGSTFMYALHAALVKRYSEHLTLTEFFLYRLLSTTGFLFVFAAGSGQIVWPGGQAWLLLLLVGTVDVVISRALYYLALRQLTMSMHTIALTLSPVVAIGWSLMLFGTSPTAQQFAGGLGILLGVLLVSLSGSRSR